MIINENECRLSVKLTYTRQVVLHHMYVTSFGDVPIMEH
jgi:hypothetical protein